MPFSKFVFEFRMLGTTIILDSMRIALSALFIVLAYIAYDVTIRLHRSRTVSLTHPRWLKLLFWVNCVCVLSALLTGKQIWEYFQEFSLVSYVSYCNLVLIAAMAFTMDRLTDTQPTARYSFFWYSIAVGFGYMAIDEFCEIHENIDMAIHQIFQITESNLTDRIDDAIILLYGIIALLVLMKARKHLHRFADVLPILKTASIYILLMIGWDAVTNRPDLFTFIVKHPFHARVLGGKLGVVEELFKILAEWMLFGALFYCITIQHNPLTDTASPRKIYKGICVFICVILILTVSMILLMHPAT